ncbi:hypothetical protein EGX86_04070 [Citrobacter koseri]|nr:hypothetical protein EGX86_04070 [Citrobacter koseri]
MALRLSGLQIPRHPVGRIRHLRRHPAVASVGRIRHLRRHPAVASVGRIRRLRRHPATAPDYAALSWCCTSAAKTYPRPRRVLINVG